MTDIYKNKALKYKLKYLKLKNNYIDNLKGGAEKKYTPTENIANLVNKWIEEERSEQEQLRVMIEALERERLRIQIEEQRRQPVVRRLQL
jgi:hypothetical protein